VPKVRKADILAKFISPEVIERTALDLLWAAMLSYALLTPLYSLFDE